ncbi:unnamed protein product, partial [Brachionus calyciflorus]
MLLKLTKYEHYRKYC